MRWVREGTILLAALVGYLIGTSGARSNVPAPAPEPPAAPLPPGAYHLRPIPVLGCITLILALAGAGVAIWQIAQSEKDFAIARALTGGDPARGPALMIRYGCSGCHTIPGVPGADGQVGPPLARLRRRVFIGGVTQNSAENLIDWITNPRALSPRTAMPATGISRAEARDIAAFLYSR
jgi:cytochrome c1